MWRRKWKRNEEFLSGFVVNTTTDVLTCVLFTFTCTRRDGVPESKTIQSR